jgi:hypothetical protein
MYRFGQQKKAFPITGRPFLLPWSYGSSTSVVFVKKLSENKVLCSSSSDFYHVDSSMISFFASVSGFQVLISIRVPNIWSAVLSVLRLALNPFFSMIRSGIS